MVKLVVSSIVSIIISSTTNAFVIPAPDAQNVRGVSPDSVSNTIGNVDIRNAPKVLTRTTNNKNGPKKVKITELDSAEDYIDFLLKDDRLCMVK